jgi:S-DNA-T family DNA segregation ATPase FtsK/SpoIIIE
MTERNVLEALLARECDILESSLIEFGVVAGVRSISVAGTAYVAYELKLGRRQLLSGIEGVLEDVSVRLAQHRRSTVRLRLRTQPSPAIEAPHPQPKPLSWKAITLGGPPSTTAVGVSYSSGRPEPVQVNLADTPHVLVAGTTGSGKSTALRAILCGLAWRTPPDDLQVRLVDLKNEALVPFENLPHCAGVGFTARSAAEEIARVADILRRRIAGADSIAQRVVLVIDELAQLDETSKARLGEILALGRSKRVNVIAATQHPTKQLVGDKSNYPLRLVGRVGDAQASALCCGRPGAGAEQLPGKGAFLSVNSDIERFQVAEYTEETAAGVVGVLRNRWPKTGGTGSEPVLEQISPAPAAENAVLAPRTGSEPVLEPPAEPVNPIWPIRPKRPPTAIEATAMRNMASTMSLTKLTKLCYGYKNDETLALVKEAL